MTDSSEPRNDEFDADDDGFALPTGSQVAGSYSQGFGPDLTESDEVGRSLPDEPLTEEPPLGETFVNTNVLGSLIRQWSRQDEDETSSADDLQDDGNSETDDGAPVDIPAMLPPVVAPMVAAMGETVGTVQRTTPTVDTDSTEPGDESGPQLKDPAGEGSGSTVKRSSGGLARVSGLIAVVVGVMTGALGMTVLTSIILGIQAYDMPDSSLSPSVPKHSLVMHQPSSDLESVELGLVVTLNGKKVLMAVSTQVEGTQVMLNDNIVRTPVQTPVAKMSKPLLVVPSLGPAGTAAFTVVGGVVASLGGAALCFLGVFIRRDKHTPRH